LQVTVSLLPQAYFVERIGGDLVWVNVMVGPGEEAHTYEPKPEQMKALSESTLFFSIGIEYEQSWLPRFADINPELLLIDSAEGIERIEESEPHSHDEGDDHGEETEDHDNDDDHDQELGLDPHVWLSPSNGKIIAENVYSALISVSPENTAFFTSNYEELIADIDALQSRITAALSGLTQRNFMVYHPAWGYFANEFGLTQIAVQTGGTDPSASELAEIIDLALTENISVIFVQPTFNAANARTIAQEVNGEVVLVDPLARDWLANLEIVANAFGNASDR